MSRTCAACIASICVFAIFGSGQTNASLKSPHVEITLPPSVASERVFVRYVLDGQDLGGAVYGPANVSSFGISTVVEGRPADRMRAIFYAPGCEIQTLDLKLTGTASPRYSFICQPVGDLELNGTIARPDRLWRHKVKLETKYIARWAGPFLGLGDIVTSIPLEDATQLSADGRFHLLLPDFSQSPERARRV